MMSDSVPVAVKDSFLDLERQRRRLEENVQQLRKSLQHWQVWEAEYEGLKEEIASLNEDQSAIGIQELEKVGKEFGGDQLNQKEIKELFQDSRGQARSATHVQGLLSRRIDYVHENVTAVERRLMAAEEKLQSATVVSQPYPADEDGLPLTEIREELDEDGNVISSTLSKPGDSTPQVLEALQKAGVEVKNQRTLEPRVEPELQSDPEKESELQHETAPLAKDRVSAPITNVVKQHLSPPANVSQGSNIDEAARLLSNGVTERPSSSRKKSVSFSEVVQIQTPIPPEDHSNANRHNRRTSQDLRDEMLLEEQKAFKNHTSAEDVNFGSPISSPVIPSDESPEDAALRRQMLDYNMNEVGAVVAEIDLDDNGSYDSERFDESDDTDAEDEDDDMEDEHGRTRRRVINDEYRAQMLALERKLNARMMENVGPHGHVDANRLDSSILPSSKPEIPTDTVDEKKAVRFADNIDISEANEGNQAPLTTPANPLSNIVEHLPTPISRFQSKNPKKPSKFKSSRLVKPDYPMTTQPPPSESGLDKPRSSFAPGETHTGTVLERAPPVQVSDPLGSADQAPFPASPDEFDDVTMDQDLAMEYNRLRNRMVQRQGGFMKATDEEENEEPEPSDLFGGPEADGGRKISRFKAARLGISK